MENKKDEMGIKNPMDKNNLGDPIPSRNQTTGKYPEIGRAAWRERG